MRTVSKCFGAALAGSAKCPSFFISFFDWGIRGPREFLGLATLQLRRELIDLSRHYRGPLGVGANT